MKRKKWKRKKERAFYIAADVKGSDFCLEISGEKAGEEANGADQKKGSKQKRKY